MLSAILFIWAKQYNILPAMLLHAES